MHPSVSKAGEGELQRLAARATRPAGTTLTALLVAASYYVGSEVGFAIKFPSIPTSIVWPPNSILMAALMLTPARRWWVYLLAVFPAHLLIQSGAAVPLPAMFLLFLTNAGEAALGAYAVRRLCGGPPRFGYMRDVIVFFVFAVFAAPFVTSFADAAAVVLTKWSDNYSLVWQARFRSNVLTVLTLVPAIVMWAVNGRVWLRELTPRRFAEACLLALGLGVSYAAAYSEFGPSFAPALFYAPLPFLMWAALRFGAGGVSTSLLAVLLISVSYAVSGRGPFTSHSAAADIVGLQLFLIAISVPTMMLAAVTEERRRAAEALKESEARNRAILQAVPDLMFLQTPDGVFLDFHARDTKELYVPPAQFIGKNVRDVLPPEVAEKFLNLFRIAGESDEPQVVEYALTMGGQERCYEARIVRSNGHFLSVVRDLTERKQAEAALRQIEMRFRATFEQAAVGVAHVSLDGRLLLMNQKLCDIVGYTAEELLPKTYKDITHPEDLDADLEVARRLLAGETETYSFEKRYVRKDGSEVWVNLTVSLVKVEATGEPSYFIAIVEDISARKAAEEALRESEKRFRTMADATPIMIWMSGPDKLCTYFNRGWLDFTGRAMEEELGNGWAEGLHPEDYDRCLEIYTTSFDARQPFSMEYRLRRHDGEYRWLFDKGVPLYSPGGAFLGYIGSCLDLTERKQAETALRESEGRLRLAQQAARVGTWEWDVRTGAAVWTEMLWRLLGLEPGEGAATHERFVEFVHPEDRDPIERKIREALAGGEEYENEFRIVRRDGEVLYLASKGRVIRSAEGRPERMLGVNIDITERKRAEQALEQLTGRLLQLQDEERRRIARELHDTTAQNLLAIVINLETLVQKASTLPRDFVDAISECQSLCEQTQGEIRTLSYLLHPPMLDEAGLILALEWFIDGFSRRSGIHVVFNAPPEFRRLPSQMETALFRVVQESLTNIYRHADSRTAEIRLERDDGQVCLRITDQGRGMAATGNGWWGPTAMRTGTLGVGISGMRERLRQLGGRLEVRSDKAGTSVTAVLPLEEEVER